MKSLTTTALLATLALTLWGCNGQESAPTASADSSASASTDTLPPNLLLTSAPQSATDIKTLRATARPGDTVVVRGVIGGRKDPLAPNRALVTLLDPSIPTCDKNMDTCKTPWDACCDPADVLAANSATIQVVGPDGRPLKAPLSTLPGVAPLKKLVVTGTYRPSPDGKAAVVDATGLYVEP